MLLLHENLISTINWIDDANDFDDEAAKARNKERYFFANKTIKLKLNYFVK